MRFRLIYCLLAVFVPTASPVAARPLDNDALVAQVLELTNAERTKAGLVPLTLNPHLQQAAQAYSQVLATSDCFSHSCGPAPDLADRDQRADYFGWTMLGENIASGYPTPEAVVAGWMVSPGHRANILSPEYTEFGVGVVHGEGQPGIYWTEEFGSRITDNST
jgi:uncharacterized protein YkwD